MSAPEDVWQCANCGEVLTGGNCCTVPNPQLVPPPTPLVEPYEVYECDCGRQHPIGFICNSPWRDKL